MNRTVETIFAEAKRWRDKVAQVTQLGSNGEPLLATKLVGRAATFVAAWAATNIPGIAGFEDVIVALVTAALSETVTDFLARHQVVPAWKAVAAAMAAKAGELDGALRKLDQGVDSVQETYRNQRQSW